MVFPRQPRRVERENWDPNTRIQSAENDLDQNDREHDSLRSAIQRAVEDATRPLKEEIRILRESQTIEIKELRIKVDRLTWALATAAVSFGLLSITFIMTQK